MENIKEGDIVRVTDSSSAVRVDSFEGYRNGISAGEFFKVVDTTSNISKYTGYSGVIVHDIFIKELSTGRIYLHTSSFVELVKGFVEEMTLKAVCEELGREIKIIK